MKKRMSMKKKNFHTKVTVKRFRGVKEIYKRIKGDDDKEQRLIYGVLCCTNDKYYSSG
jgi:hypothetical protein